MSGLTVLPPDEVEVEYEDEEEILVWALLELAHGWPHPASLLHTSPLNTATVKVSAGDHPLLADSSLDTATACAVYTAHRPHCHLPGQLRNYGIVLLKKLTPTCSVIYANLHLSKINRN